MISAHRSTIRCRCPVVLTLVGAVRWFAAAVLLAAFLVAFGAGPRASPLPCREAGNAQGRVARPQPERPEGTKYQTFQKQGAGPRSQLSRLFAAPVRTRDATLSGDLLASRHEGNQ